VAGGDHPEPAQESPARRWANYHGAHVKSCSCDSDCSHDGTPSLNLPALVDERTWREVQGQVASRRGRVLGGRATGGVSETFLLLGLLFCGECGERLACRKARQTNSVDRYACQGRRRKGCVMPTLRRELLDDAIRQHFVSKHVVDTEESVRRERDRLLSLRSNEATSATRRAPAGHRRAGGGPPPEPQGPAGV
jgi:hypothetical protein